MESYLDSHRITQQKVENTNKILANIENKLNEYFYKKRSVS